MEAQVDADMAQLAPQGLPALAEVGALLGYTEQSALSRAFKRWTGQAPVQWRQQQGR